jgi:hypothetical protein
MGHAAKCAALGPKEYTKLARNGQASSGLMQFLPQEIQQMLAGGMGGGGGGGMFPGMPGMPGGGMYIPGMTPMSMMNNNPMESMMRSCMMTSVLMDPSLSVEDKVMILLMLVCNFKDRDIEREMRDMANTGGVPGAMGQPGKVPYPGRSMGPMMGDNSEGQDIKAARIQRLVQSRQSIFEMLTKVMESYDRTKREVAQAMGR